ncbi:MAG: hypothetical protein NTW54_10445 [Bacteroidetes bacterium]|nr:hypothetical protein [Bacteroidota bacterium]
MKQKIIQYVHKPNTREYFNALANYPMFIKLLNPEGKTYRRLYDWLKENKDMLTDEQTKLPSIKELSAKLEIEASKIAKQFRMIYNDIVDLNWNQPNLFCEPNRKLCLLSFNYLESYAQFYLGLEIIPRVGESFSFPFVYPQNGGHSFYVKSVSHFYERDGQGINIDLNSEFPSQYLQLLKEKALLHNEITFTEFLTNSRILDEYLVKLHNSL